jgi:hypothetical protein
MASNIDATKPAEGQAKTANVRSNFQSAKEEIETLQGQADTALARSQYFDTDGNFDSTQSVTVRDASFSIVDADDSTRAAGFDLANLTNSTTRTLTVQDVNGTIYVTGGQDVAVTDGGTGASSASAARTNLDVYSTAQVDNLVDDLSGVTAPDAARGNLEIASGSVSLNTTGTSTTVSNSAVTSNSRIVLFPHSEAAASLEGQDTYVSSVSAGSGFTLTHADFSGTRTYDYVVIG